MDESIGTAPDLGLDIGDRIDAFADIPEASEGSVSTGDESGGGWKMPSIADLIDGVGHPVPEEPVPAALEPVVPDAELPELVLPEPAAPEVVVPELVVPDLDLPAIEIPDIEIPKVDLPDFGLPDFGTPSDAPAPSDAAPPAPEAEAPEPVDEPPADGNYGNAAAWTADWFYQEVNGYCGPSSAAQLISEFTGLDISSPQQMVDRALELGLFYNDDPSMGMVPGNVQVLLEDQGVPCHSENGDLEDLKAKLEAGHGVIAIVDSGEIWMPEAEFGEDNVYDHVTVVSGVDEARGVVILSDTGTPEGNGLEVPIAQFMDAWGDSNNLMIVSDEADTDLGGGSDSVASLQPRPWAMLDLIGPS